MIDKAMKDKAIRAIQRTWSYISDDMLYECGGSISAEEAREVTLDADRLYYHGYDNVAVRWFFNLPRDEQDEIATEAIPVGYKQ